MPKWLQSVVKPVLVPLVRRFLFMRFLEQDVEMMESEQRIFRQNPQRRYVEVNPAILALQRVLVRQYEQFVQQSSQLEHRHPEPSDPTQTEAEILVSLSSEPASESPVW